MFIFSNIESHLWIAYLFFANGYLAQLLFRRYSQQFSNFTESFEAQALAAFFLSIGLNGLLLYLLDIAALPFSIMFVVLGVLTVILFLGCCLNFKHLQWRCDIGYLRPALYLCIFLMLFYNGGLIEQISDAWWHMSLANKISIASSYTIEPGHLTGAYERYYPPLWHANLALAKIVSGISIPIFWNSFTAWGAVVKVMAFYLFAYSLSADKRIAVLSACLFILIPSIGNSYLRVSAWPSHVSYTAWFALFYMSAILLSQFNFLNQLTLKQNLIQLGHSLWKAKVNLLCIAVLLVLILFTHKAEILWFAVAWLAYLVACSVYRAFDSSLDYLAYRDNFLNYFTYRLALIALMIFSLWFFYQRGAIVLTDKNLAYLLPFFCFLGLLLTELLGQKVGVLRLIARLSFIGLVAVLLITINYTHLLSLFVRELALPSSGIRPAEAVALLGGKLSLPSWHHQLGGGLLYSGILSIPISWALAFYKPSRLTLFIAATGTTVILFCISPYLFQWLNDVLAYHSTWRIALIVFHPIVLAATLVFMFDYWRGQNHAT